MRLHPNTSKTRSHEPCGDTHLHVSLTPGAVHRHAPTPNQPLPPTPTRTLTHTAHRPPTHPTHTPRQPSPPDTPDSTATLVHAARDLPCSRSLLAAATAYIYIYMRSAHTSARSHGPNYPWSLRPEVAAAHTRPHSPALAHTCRTRPHSPALARTLSQRAHTRRTPPPCLRSHTRARTKVTRAPPRALTLTRARMITTFES